MNLPDFLDERDGEVRLAGHRVRLCDPIASSNQGRSAEMLGEQFPSLWMAIIHKALGFYREHQGELDADASRARAALDAVRNSGESVALAALRSGLAARAVAARAD